MTVEEFYKRIHGDYEDMIARIPSDELILSLVRQFPLDDTYEKLMTAVKKRDVKASFEAAHNLKGLASNLSFSELFVAVNVLTDQLRSRAEPADKVLVTRVEECYQIIIQTVKCLEDDGCP